ncbi:hypothetical protein [Ralstonia pseudosolanacearum]|uniref:hypothetical protein n=1 Tax=Ralstonia pseudosolanacearum TaxID=1310165 RepID=UPI0018D0C5DA|nr:hypothetical protein [Ralstonia pseudosolanacearum]
MSDIAMPTGAALIIQKRQDSLNSQNRSPAPINTYLHSPPTQSQNWLQCIAQLILFSFTTGIQNAGGTTGATPVTRGLAHNAGVITIIRCRSNGRSSPKPTAMVL